MVDLFGAYQLAAAGQTRTGHQAVAAGLAATLPWLGALAAELLPSGEGQQFEQGFQAGRAGLKAQIMGRLP